MLLEIDQLNFGYNQKPLIHDLSLKLASGQVIAILGGNGAGKSTLLKLILGLLTPTSGSVRLNGAPLIQQTNAVAYLPEQASLYPYLSGLENLEYLLSLCGKPRKHADLSRYLQQVGLNEEAWHMRTSAYSKGMRQKLMIAFALAREAKLLLLDEPNSGLDPIATSDLSQLILSLKTQQVGMLIVSHDLMAVHQVADQCLMLNNGSLNALAIENPLDLNKIYRIQAHV